jgi:hypothetical protein
MPVQSGRKGWITSVTWLPDLSAPPSPASQARNTGGAQVQGGGGRAVYQGRPCVVVTQDDGRVGIMSVKTGSLRYLFARPFVFWHTAWLAHSSELLLASSEGEVLKILLDDATIASALPVPQAHLLLAVRLLPATPRAEQGYEIRSVKSGATVRVAREERQERAVAAASSGSDNRCFKDYVARAPASSDRSDTKSCAPPCLASDEVADKGKLEQPVTQPVLKLPPIQAGLHRVVSTVLVPPSPLSPPITLVLAAGRAGLVLCKVTK